MTREHPRRRRFQVIRHAEPAEALLAMAEPPTAPLPAVEEDCEHGHTVGLYCVACDERQADVSRETSDELPPLSPARVARLEALTAVWTREVRAAGPADSTLLYAAPRPPVPPARPAPGPQPAPGFELDVELLAGAQALAAELASERARPARVSDWTSRHDPRSLEYAVRDRLRTPVPLQDLLLERGPVLDQGTTPPLGQREASACVGMAVAAAVNVLDASRRNRLERDRPFLGEEDARRLYARAQELDHVSGEDYAGTSVLAGMKAGQEAGYWDTYLWALGGTRDLAQALLQLHAPVVLGLPWSADLEAPDSDGVIIPGGAPAGGHCVAVVGMLRTVAGRPGWWFVLQQSRGTDEGAGGLVYVHHRDLARLLAGRGEAAVPLPRWLPM